MITINESFECLRCHCIVPKAQGTCRNHCPYCFVSRHVDGAIPGDRKTSCKGFMFPLSYQYTHGILKILFECQSCEKQHRNKTAADDNVIQLDEYIVLYHDLTPHQRANIEK